MGTLKLNAGIKPENAHCAYTRCRSVPGVKQHVRDEMTNTSKASKPAKKSRKGRRTRRKQDEFVRYELRVNDWNYYYGFRISDPKSRFDKGPYSELATLTFKGVMVSPESLKYEMGELTLSAQNNMMNERLADLQHTIGSLSAYGDTLTGYVFVPAERLSELAAAAASGRIQVASIDGTRLKYRSGTIRGITLNTETDEEELIGSAEHRAQPKNER